MLKYLSLIILINKTLSVTVGGISAGCFMSTQLNYIYSSIITGNACIAGGPYWCAQNNVDIALSECMKQYYSDFIDIKYLETILYETEKLGFIDQLINLKKSKVWLFSAKDDSVVNLKVVQKNVELYNKFIDSSKIKFVNNINGEHAQLTNNFGNKCTYLGLPYINNCDYDSAGNGLQWLYLNLSYPENKFTSTNLIEFNQTKFMPVEWHEKFGLNKVGYIYVPTYCKTKSCDLHIVFHGCEQTLDDIGLKFINSTGYLEWGETNNIKILFPQSVKSNINPKGCFDWWGYTGADYASNIGIQPKTIFNLINNFL